MSTVRGLFGSRLSGEAGSLNPGRCKTHTLSADCSLVTLIALLSSLQVMKYHHVVISGDTKDHDPLIWPGKASFLRPVRVPVPPSNVLLQGGQDARGKVQGSSAFFLGGLGPPHPSVHSAHAGSRSLSTTSSLNGSDTYKVRCRL